ncbi:hypothetical protein [Rheinheimera faecalis]|uniref:hypothetical protein n=1 Tax=Rheinheimera faecalis TaxID=2901141 RepID=UPI001E3C8E4B|nr:hypothetical protein [Rheinheimera faecalis]
MFKWLSWVRSYYLYGYYFMSWNVKRKEHDAVQGFMAMVGLIMVLPAGAVLGAFNKWHYFLDDSMREHLFNFRGSVNHIVLLGAFVSCLLTYLVCCAGIKFADIEPRLAKIPYFAERKLWKFFLLWMFNIAFSLIVLNYLYK